MLKVQAIISFVPSTPIDVEGHPEVWVGVFRQDEDPYFYTVHVDFWVNCVVSAVRTDREVHPTSHPAILAAEITKEPGPYGNIHFFEEADNFIRLALSDENHPWFLESGLKEEFKRTAEQLPKFPKI